MNKSDAVTDLLLRKSKNRMKVFKENVKRCLNKIGIYDSTIGMLKIGFWLSSVRNYSECYFDKPYSRKSTFSIKWNRNDNVVNPMDVADMDFRGPCVVSKALALRSHHCIYGYTSDFSYGAIKRFMWEQHRIAIENCIFSIPNVRMGLSAALKSVTDSGDSVIILPPVYGGFERIVLDNNRRLIKCELLCDEAGIFKMDYEAIEKACNGGAKALFLCNPQNPVGKVWTEEELVQLAEICLKRNVTIISDETYMDIVLHPWHFTSVMNLNKDYRSSIISFFSPCKTFNMAGLHCAYGLCENRILKDRIEKELSAAGAKVTDAFEINAAWAAYSYGEKWLKAMLLYLKKGAEVFRDELNNLLPKAVISPVEGGYYVWVDLRKYGISSDDLVSACKKEGLAVMKGDDFSLGDNSQIRINFACPHKRIRMAARQLARAIYSLE